MTSEGGTGGGISGWVWAALAGAVVVAVVLGFVLFSDGDEEAADTTTTAEATTTTEEATSTTTEEATTTTTEEATTTTTEEATTTSVAAAEEVPVTPVVGELAPYPPAEEGAALLPDPVEAHWYQYEGLYVVLYRGFDASSGQEICAGNSILIEGAGFSNITNSPHIGSADEICVGTAKIAEPPSGVYVCDTLLYYLTEIPTESTGTLFGTLEIGTADGFVGQTSEAVADLAATPEFVPNLGAYELPPSNVDPGGVVTCSS